jgi:orotidine-5'-phosphate decarboxylase
LPEAVSTACFLPMNLNFTERLERAWDWSGSLLCIGLDPQTERLPDCLQGSERPFFTFNKAIIEATRGLACAYKPQFAHYAAAGRLDELEATLQLLRERVPEAICILDAKRGDIGSTAERYAKEAFDIYGADAVTVNPYMGGDTLQPFTNYGDRGVVVLCKTSNAGSGDLQNLALEKGGQLFEEVARLAATDWNANGNIALVVGATYPEELAQVRKWAPQLPILVPGIGAQGGDLEGTLRAGLRPDGKGLLINSSRGIIYASAGEDFAEAAAQAARELGEAINRYPGRVQR